MHNCGNETESLLANCSGHFGYKIESRSGKREEERVIQMQKGETLGMKEKKEEK